MIRIEILRFLFVRLLIKRGHNILEIAYEKLLEAEESRRAGSLEVAERIVRSLLDEYPSYWGAQHTLGLVHYDKSEFDHAYASLSRAMLLNPGNPLTLAIFARTCLELGAFELAARTLNSAIEIDPQNSHILFACGELHRHRQEFDIAVKFYRSAINVNPNNVQATTAIASCLRKIGLMAEAATLLQSQLPLRMFEPLVELSALPSEINEVDLLDELAKVSAPPPHKAKEYQVATAFIKATGLYRRGEFEDAWSQLVEANRFAITGREAELEERRAYEKATLETTQAVFGRYKIRQHQPDWPLSVLILGPSSSGKSTVERLLSAGERVHTCFESRILQESMQSTFLDAGLLPGKSLGLLPTELHEEFRDRYHKALRKKNSSSAIFTITRPSLISDAVRIAAVIPNIRFIFLRRRLEDTLLRIFMKHYRSGNVYSYNLDAARQHILWYEELMNFVSRCFPEISFQVQYEELIENPVKVVGEAKQFIGINAAPMGIPEVGDDRGCAAPFSRFLSPAS